MRDILKWLRGWFPHIGRYQANWCGKVMIIHAPRHISRWTGHGEAGLELYRRQERGHAIK